MVRSSTTTQPLTTHRRLEIKCENFCTPTYVSGRAQDNKRSRQRMGTEQRCSLTFNSLITNIYFLRLTVNLLGRNDDPAEPPSASPPSKGGETERGSGTADGVQNFRCHVLIPIQGSGRTPTAGLPALLRSYLRAKIRTSVP